MTPGYVLVVATSRDDPFTALFFGGLPPDILRHVRIRAFGVDSLTSSLAGAAAVIVMRRGLFDFGGLSAYAGVLDIPRYYFVDDNFMIVREEPDLYGPDFSEYTDDNVRRALSGFEGVLLGSRPLVEYFAQRSLHPRLVEYPPIAWPILRPRAPGGGRAADEPFRIAFFGGDHRRDVLATIVHPAIRRLASRHAVELIVAGVDPAALPPAANMRVVHQPYDVRYGEALRQLARHRIDVLVHPTPPTRNNPYKNANVLINARAVGAVPVLSDLPPYDTLGSPPPALLCANRQDAWYDALARLADDRDLGDEVFQRVERYCHDHFSGDANAEAIRRILAAHRAPARATRVARRVIAGPPLAFDRAGAWARRTAGNSRLLRSAVRYVRGRAAL
jgi:glycosyltransferase involved in cell wall biosynthesis